MHPVLTSPIRILPSKESRRMALLYSNWHLQSTHLGQTPFEAIYVILESSQQSPFTIVIPNVQIKNPRHWEAKWHSQGQSCASDTGIWLRSLHLIPIILLSELKCLLRRAFTFNLLVVFIFQIPFHTGRTRVTHVMKIPDLHVFTKLISSWTRNGT